MLIVREKTSRRPWRCFLSFKTSISGWERLLSSSWLFLHRNADNLAIDEQPPRLNPLVMFNFISFPFRIKDNYALYALQKSKNTEIYRRTLLSHLMQLVEVKEHSSTQDAQTLLIKMFMTSQHFDLVLISIMFIIV